VLAASGALLLLAANPHGGEHLKALLEGQILWVSAPQLVALAMAYAALALVWYFLHRRAGRVTFYVLFACAVTASVQLVGLYLVFTTLIVPALATRTLAQRRLVAGYALSVFGYALGLALSILADLPSGPAIVWTMCASALLFSCFTSANGRASHPT
jgi:zinc/manganese transport system permease protein